MLSFIEVLAVIVPLLVTCLYVPLLVTCLSYQEPQGLERARGSAPSEFLTRLLSVVVIILIHSLQLMAAWGWGYLNHYYIKYTIVPQSWLQSITDYHVNKHLGILTPRHERRYFRILATLENSLTFERRVTFIYFPNYYSIIIWNLPALNVFNTDYIIN